MTISTKGRYALRMLVDLAEHQDRGYIALRDIAVRQGISKKYLEQIIPLLNQSDILLATRGFQGGYRLFGRPEEYTVGQILRITEGKLAPVACLKHDPVECSRSGQCPTLPVWRGLYQVINEYLDSITLQDILDGNVQKRWAGRPAVHHRGRAARPCVCRRCTSASDECGQYTGK